jgi:DNA polymerase-3 subunit alpha
VHIHVRGVRKTTVYGLPITISADAVASDVKATFGQDAWLGVA